jgi:hypothetical protein
MGSKPPEKRSIERKLVNGNYTPENCKWATDKEQARNKRNNVMLTYGDKTQCVADWADEVGIDADTIRYRLRQGWPVDKALITPSQRKNR